MDTRSWYGENFPEIDVKMAAEPKLSSNKKLSESRERSFLAENYT